MTTVIVRHNVKDFEQWKSTFSSMSGVRAQHGCREETIYRSIEDPLRVVIRTEWGSPEQARSYFTSKALKEGMARAGVVGEPTVDLLAPTK